MTLISNLFLGLGLFVCLISILGLIRFPDVYTRLHASTKASTLGSLFITFGTVLTFLPGLEDGEFELTVHALVAVLLIIFTNPISAHAIARAAMIAGIKPVITGVDEYNSPTADDKPVPDAKDKIESEKE